jgi:phage/plasmid-associated DNA primase
MCEKATTAINKSGEQHPLRLVEEDMKPDGVDQHIVDMIARPGTTAPTASLLLQACGDHVICDENQQWFYVRPGDYRWGHTTAEAYLKSKMQGDVCRMFKDRAPHSYFWGNDPSKPFPYHKVVSNLMTNRNQNEVLSAFGAMSSQLHPKFAEGLDENHYLLGFNNGVVELMRPGEESSEKWKANLKGWLFRPGTPADMVSMTVGCDFEPDWATATKHQDEYDTFTNKIFKGDELEHYRLVCAWILCGNLSIRRKFLLMPGNGGNSKSIQGKLFGFALGDYANTSMSSAAIQQSGRDRHDEEHATKLALMKGKRVAVASEPKRSLPYDQNQIKKLRGGDPLSARPAFGKASDIVTFVSQASLVQLLNYCDLPLIDHDPAFEKSVDVLPMKSTFGERADKSPITVDDDEKREYMEDTSLDTKLPFFQHCWLKAALDAYPRFLANPNFEFEHSKEAWKEMLAHQSAVGTFLSETYVHVSQELYNKLDPNKRHSRINQYHVQVHDMWEEFQRWKVKQTKAAFKDDAITKKHFNEKIFTTFAGSVTSQKRTVSNLEFKGLVERHEFTPGTLDEYVS